MKKRLAVLLALLCVAGLVAGCQEPTQPPSAPSADMVRERLMAVAKGDAPFMGEDGEETSRKNGMVTIPSLAEAYRFAPLTYTYADLENDGTDELILFDEAQNYYWLLHYASHDGEIYGYFLAARAFVELCTDCSFWAFDGAAVSTRARIAAFSGTEIVYEELAFQDETQNIYRVDGKPATQQEAAAVLGDKQVTPVAWTSWTEKTYVLPSVCETFLATHAEEHALFAYAMRDMDGDGTEELLIKEGTALAVYAVGKTVTKLDEHDFLTGTSRFLVPNASAFSYNGIVHFSIGGGAEWYSYWTVKDGKWHEQTLFHRYYTDVDDEHTAGDVDYVTCDRDLNAAALEAYYANRDLPFVTYEVKGSAVDNAYDKNITAKAHFTKALSGEEIVWNTADDATLLAHCATYDGQVYAQVTQQMAYIDVDGDGVVEALLDYGANGNHILHYDFTDERIYAIFFTPKGGCVFFANGEYGANEETATRRRVTQFNKGTVITKTIDYIDGQQSNERPVWTAIKIAAPVD